VLGASAGQLMAAEKISEAVAQSIIYWTGDRQNRDLIKRLDKLGVNLKSELYGAAAKPGAA
jgi:NAD-dependent DNA ligase